jgi:hypothetical protein
MSETSATVASTSSWPEGYDQVLHWTMPSHSMGLQLLALPLSIVAGVAFFGLAITLGRLPFDSEGGVLWDITLLLGVLLTFILHELTHGLAMRICGARTRYGILLKPLILYATSPGYAFRHNAYVVITLAPLIGLSGLAILGMVIEAGTSWVALFALCATINTCGAIGDLWFTKMLLRYPGSAYIVDEQGGFRVFLPKKTLTLDGVEIKPEGSLADNRLLSGDIG